jgi:8-oxo-dGTP pyrophosphatase MutT (NUDIX family)
MQNVWKPNVTVAAVIERGGRFLCVQEHTREGTRINQPAGHLEPGESIIEACVRETLEESAYAFTPTHLLGVYLWRNEADTTFLRFAFVGELGAHHASRPLDQAIVRTWWLTGAELAAREAEHRSPLVARCVRDYQSGQRFELEAVFTHETVGQARMCRSRESGNPLMLTPLIPSSLDSRRSLPPSAVVGGGNDTPTSGAGDVEIPPTPLCERGVS